MNKVWVLVRTYDVSDDGFEILGVFNNIFLLKEIIKKNFSDYVYEKDLYGGESWIKRSSILDHFTEYYFLNIYEFKLNEVEQK